MSYKNIKVNSESPDLNNSISIDTTNLIETGRVGINCILRKTSTGWGTPSCLKSYAGHLNFEEDYHGGNTNYRYQNEHNYCTRKASGEYDLNSNITFDQPDSKFSPLNNSNWTKSYLFNGAAFNNKKVLLKAIIGPSQVFTNAYYTIQWRVGSPDDPLSSTLPLGPMSYGKEQYGSICYGLYTGTGTSEYVSIRFIDVYGYAITTGSVASIQSITAKIIE